MPRALGSMLPRSVAARSAIRGLAARRSTAGLGAGLGLLLLSACGAADATRADGSASLEAVLSIERLEEAGHSDTPSPSAMAPFVILPPDAAVHDTLGAAGLRAQLPERAGCVDLVAADAAATA